jgi:hypothetical protein
MGQGEEKEGKGEANWSKFEWENRRRGKGKVKEYVRGWKSHYLNLANLRA